MTPFTLKTPPPALAPFMFARVIRFASALFLAWVACASFAGSAAQAQQDQPAPGYKGEYIDSVSIHYDIREDGSLAVEETIRVFVTGDEIKRGIYRAFPNDRREAYQTNYLPIANLSVTRNGAVENIGKDEINSAFYTTYFGYSDRFIEKNQFHTYVLRYTVPKAILQFEDADNFDWNVIGFDWVFAIRAWEVKITYPGNAVVLDDRIFTGFRGSNTATKLDRVNRSASTVLLSGAPLDPGEGVTYVLRFDPSLISPREGYPVINQAYFGELERQRQAALEAERQRQEQEAAARAETRARLIAEAQEMLPRSLALLLAIGVLWLLAVVVWLLVGRQKSVMPVVVPQFYPPNMVGPAASRYIRRMGNINPTKLLVTGIVSLAVKGSVKIENKNIERISPKESNLTPAEIGILNDLNLTLTGKSFSMKTRTESKAARLKKAGKNLTKRLKDEYRENFRSNWLWLLLSLMAVTLTWCAAGVLSESYVVITEWGFSVLSLIIGLVVLRPGQNLLSTGTVLYGLCTGGLLYMAINWIPLGNQLYYLPVHLSFLASAVLIYFVRVHINNFSQAGGEIAAQLHGLEMYIKAAERGSLQDEPEPSFDHFSKVYPYAFALGLHTVWAGKFSRELEAWAADDQFSDHLWYSSHYNAFEDTLDRFEDRFQSTSSYASPSSSGSGGSSFSGGGGGGGGGGGW